MIHYHGGPVTPVAAQIEVWRRRHAFVSFAHPAPLEVALEVCQSVAVDPGAYTFWKTGGELDVPGYAAWIKPYRRHPAFDWALIPDSIDGGEEENDRLIAEWYTVVGAYANIRQDVPVWHLHESLGRLKRLVHAYSRVALGSSGKYANPGSPEWEDRMEEAMSEICDANGQPPCKLHGLRMLDPEIFRRFPLASADSTNVARNIGYDVKWTGSYQPLTKFERALVMAGRIEHFNSAASWQSRPRQDDLFDERNWQPEGALR